MVPRLILIPLLLSAVLSGVSAARAQDKGSIDPKPLLRALREEYGVVLSGGQAELAGKIVRFGTMGDVDESDFQTAFAAIEDCIWILRKAEL